MRPDGAGRVLWSALCVHVDYRKLAQRTIIYAQMIRQDLGPYLLVFIFDYLLWNHTTSDTSCLQRVNHWKGVKSWI